MRCLQQALKDLLTEAEDQTRWKDDDAFSTCTAEETGASKRELIGIAGVLVTLDATSQCWQVD